LTASGSDKTTSAGYTKNDFLEIDLHEDLNNLEVIKDETSKLRMVASQVFIVIYIMNMLSVITGFFTVNNFKRFAQLNDIRNE